MSLCGSRDVAKRTFRGVRKIRESQWIVDDPESLRSSGAEQGLDQGNGNVRHLDSRSRSITKRRWPSLLSPLAAWPVLSFPRLPAQRTTSPPQARGNLDVSLLLTTLLVPSLSRHCFVGLRIMAFAEKNNETVNRLECFDRSYTFSPIRNSL